MEKKSWMSDLVILFAPRETGIQSYGDHNELYVTSLRIDPLQD
jgi:hypothetical protein